VNRRALSLFVVLWTSGCGYHFTAGGAPLPEGIRAVRVPVFANKTAEPGLEAVFTDAMRLQLVRAGLDSPPNAEAEIRGEILSVSAAGTLLTTTNALASYRLYSEVHVRLLKNGRTLADAAVTGFTDFLPGVDVLQTEANRGAALQRLAATLAHDGYERLATGW